MLCILKQQLSQAHLAQNGAAIAPDQQPARRQIISLSPSVFFEVVLVAPRPSALATRIALSPDRLAAGAQPTHLADRESSRRITGDKGLSVEAGRCFIEKGAGLDSTISEPAPVPRARVAAPPSALGSLTQNVGGAAAACCLPSSLCA